MTRPGSEAALEGARGEVLAIAEEFTRATGPILEAALRRRVRALIERERSRLAPEVREALDGAAAGAIAAGVREVQRRLSDPDVWLRPLTAPGVVPRPETGWDGILPGWISDLLRRFGRREEPPGLGDLDDPGNRVWVALLSAATPLDPILEEFGLRAAPAPNLGGGHHGLQPRTAAELDPSGALVRVWRRYRGAYVRYAALAGDTPGATG